VEAFHGVALHADAFICFVSICYWAVELCDTGWPECIIIRLDDSQSVLNRWLPHSETSLLVLYFWRSSAAVCAHSACSVSTTF
jgi:hypothetical protein